MLNPKKVQSTTSVPEWTALMLVGAAFIWGATFIAGRHLAVNTPPLLSAFLRFLIASLVMYFFLPTKPSQHSLSANHKLLIFLLGLIGIFFYNVCFFSSFQFISASRSSLIVAMSPAGIGLASFIFLNERIGITQWLGIVFSLVGVATIIISKDPTALAMGANTWKGDSFIMGCVASWVTYTMISKRIIAAIGIINSLFYSLVVGTVLLGAAALITGQANLTAILQLSYLDWLSLLFLGVLSSALSCLWYYKGIEQIGATQASVYISLVPVFGVSLGMLLLNEPITLLMVIGGIKVILGVYLCNWRATNLSRDTLSEKEESWGGASSRQAVANQSD